MINIKSNGELISFKSIEEFNDWVRTKEEEISKMEKSLAQLTERLEQSKAKLTSMENNSLQYLSKLTKQD